MKMELRFTPKGYTVDGKQYPYNQSDMRKAITAAIDDHAHADRHDVYAPKEYHALILRLLPRALVQCRKSGAGIKPTGFIRKPFFSHVLPEVAKGFSSRAKANNTKIYEEIEKAYYATETQKDKQ